MNGLPYYKAYPRDFFDGTRGMDFEVKAAYRLILDLIYQHGGRLSDDARFIAGSLGCSVKKWNLLRSAIIGAGKLEVSGGFLANYRADKELEILRSFQDTQRKNASGPRKNNGLSGAMDLPPLSQSEPEPEVKREAIASLKKQPKRRPEIELPEGWLPSDRNIQDAQARNFTASEIDHEADKFRNHHLAKGSRFRDWDRAWLTWLGNAAQFRARGGMAGQAKAPGYGQRSSLASIVARRRAQGEV